MFIMLTFTMNRKELIAMGRKDNPALRKQVTKVIRELEEQGRKDFVKQRGSYYAGEGSKVDGYSLVFVNVVYLHFRLG